MQMKPSTLVALAVAAFVPTRLPAQAPSVQDIAKTAHTLAQQLGELRDDGDKKDALAAKKKELAAFVALCVKGEGFTEQHFVEASSPLIEDEWQAGLAISEAGTAKFPQSRFLHDHVGAGRHLGALAERPSAARVAGLNSSEAAWRKALQCKPDTWHAHFGLYQVLEHLGYCDEALRELDTALKNAEAKKAINVQWLRRAGLLMRTERAKEALAVLAAAVPEDDEDKVAVQIMVLRATALAGDAEATQAAANALRTLESSPRTLVEAADALAYAGKKPEALALLAQRPKRAKPESEEQREAQLYSQSAEAMEAFLKATDHSPGGPLRAALTKALDHHFLTMEGGKQEDFASSPLMMSKLLGSPSMPEEPIKDWGNHVLFVLSMRAVPAYKPSPAEKKLADMLKKDRWPTADDIPCRLLELRKAVGEPDEVGALTALRAVEKLDPKKPPAPTKK